MNWLDVIARGPARKPCLVTELGTLSYGELLHYARRVCGGFARRGWVPGTRIFLAVSDDRHALCLVAAALANGLVPVLADPTLPSAAAAILRHVANTRAVVIDVALANSWGLADDHDNIWQISAEPARRAGELYRRLLRRPSTPREGWLAELDGGMDSSPAWQPTGDAPAMVIYTSGTTARPKGVELGHHAIAAHLSTLVRQYGYDDQSEILNFLPWHHVDGIICGALVAVAAGATLHRAVPFRITNVQRIVDTLYTARITHFVVVPTVLAIILRLVDGLRDAFEAPDLRMVISSAGYLDEGLWRKFEARFRVKVVNAYGMTETVACGLFCGPDDATRRVGTLGRPVDCHARVVDPQGHDLADGETGELWLAGENLMRGYLGDPEATREVLQNGWLRTGDLVRRDSDGFIWFAGRLKNVLKSGGHTVQPEEITAVLKSHPAVADAATIGISHAELEQVAVAAVVLAPGAAANEAVLIDHCRSHLAAYKIPRLIVILRELPYGPSGKVRIEALRQIILEDRPDGESGGQAGRVLDIARRCFRSQATLSPASAPDFTPGWDSMAHLEFVMALEAAFGIRLSSQDIMNLTSLAAAIEIVKNARHHG